MQNYNLKSYSVLSEIPKYIIDTYSLFVTVNVFKPMVSNWILCMKTNMQSNILQWNDWQWGWYVIADAL